MTPTAATAAFLTQYDPVATNPPSSPSGVQGSMNPPDQGPFPLFSLEEARFMTDSFASAQSFDPFKYGAPGFKVPAILPPELIHSLTAPGSTISSLLRTALTNGQEAQCRQQFRRHQHQQKQPGGASSPSLDSLSCLSSLFQGLSGAMSSARLQHQSWDSAVQSHDSFPWVSSNNRSDPSSSNRPGQQSWAMGNANADHSQHQPRKSFEEFVRRSGLQATGASGMSHDAARSHRHAQSFSGPIHSVDEQVWAWKSADEHQALQHQAQASRPMGGAYGQNRAWQMQQLEALRAERRRFLESLRMHADKAPPSMTQSDRSAAAYTLPPVAQQPLLRSSAIGTGTFLSTLGLSFASSHKFPATSPSDGRAAENQPLASLEGCMADGNAHSRVRSNTSAERPLAANSTQKQSASSKEAQQAEGDVSSHDLSYSGSSSGLYCPWAKALSPLEPSEAYPPLKLDFSAVSRKQFASKFGDESLEEAFFGRDPFLERRNRQPHLVHLKQRRKEVRAWKAQMLKEKRRKVLQRKGLDPEAASALKGSDGDDDDAESGGFKDSTPDGGAGSDGAGGSVRKGKRAAHVLLTEAEKKANHIASEQKRRANIRKGYEMLCAGVPALQKALEKGKGEEGVGVEGGGEDGLALEMGGERIDGRKVPRSEAVVLGKSVEHLRHLLEIHRDLRFRRDHARVKLARNSFAANILVGLGGDLIKDMGAAASGKAPKRSSGSKFRSSARAAKSEGKGSSQHAFCKESRSVGNAGSFAMKEKDHAGNEASANVIQECASEGKGDKEDMEED